MSAIQYMSATCDQVGCDLVFRVDRKTSKPEFEAELLAAGWAFMALTPVINRCLCPRHAAEKLDGSVKLEAQCPHCAVNLTGHMASEDPNDRSPRPGDVTFCWNCGSLSVFSEEMGLREPTTEEALQLLGDKEVTEVITELRKFREECGGSSAV